jgi:hypothetical protein
LKELHDSFLRWLAISILKVQPCNPDIELLRLLTASMKRYGMGGKGVKDVEGMNRNVH